MNYCNFADNGNFALYAESCNDPITVINAQNNYWIATDSSIIADSLIYDNLDDPESPVVEFMPYLSDKIFGTIAGLIVDNQDNPIENAIIELSDGTFIDTTAADGSFLIDSVNMNYHNLTITHDDYNDTAFYDIYIPIHDTTEFYVQLSDWAGCDYVVGDANNNGVFNGLDVVYGVAYLKGGPPPPFECECPPTGTWFVAGDVNSSCSYNGLDITFAVLYFKGGTPEISPCPYCPPIE